MTPGYGMRVGEGAMGALLLALGVFIAVAIGQMEVAATYAAIGPKLFPYLVAAGLVVIGLLTLRQALFDSTREEESPKYDWLAVGLISGGLLAQMALVERGGWILAAAALFMIVARAFGSRRLYADAALGFALSTLTFVAFTSGLDLSLPGGVIGDMLTGAE